MCKHQTQTGPLPVTGSETRLDWNLTARGCFLVIQFVLYFSLSPLQPAFGQILGLCFMFTFGYLFIL